MSDDFDVQVKAKVEELKEVKKQIPVLARHIAQAQKAGIDVTGMKENLRETEARLNKFVSAYSGV